MGLRSAIEYFVLAGSVTLIGMGLYWNVWGCVFVGCGNGVIVFSVPIVTRWIEK